MSQNNPHRVDIQRISANLRRVVSALLVAMILLLGLERFSHIAIRIFQEGFHDEVARRLAVACVSALPEVLYLLALGWIRQALAAFAQGKLFSPTIARMLSRVGTMLAAGAFINVFLVPSASRALGFGPGYVIAYDVSGLVLGAVGLSLMVIALVLRRAAEMQTELDEIF